MKKLLCMALVCVMVFGVLAGCGSKKEDDGIVEISLSGFFPDPTTEPDAHAKFMETVAAFETKYPNVKVIDEDWSFDVQTYMAKAEGGTLPTVYELPLTEVNKVLELGYAADLTEEFESRGWADMLTEKGKETIMKDGKYYFVPQSNGLGGLLVNLDLYSKAGFVAEDGTPYQPKDWEDLARVAKTIKEKTGAAGFCIPTTQNQGGWRTTPMAWSYGVDFMEKDADGKWKATFNTSEYVDMFELIHKMKWEDDSLTAASLIGYQEPMKMLAAGEVGMIFGDVSYSNMIVTRHGMNKDNIGAMALPAGPARHVALMSGGLYTIDRNATPEQIKAVLDWLVFTGETPEIDDSIKANMDQDLANRIELGQIIGLEKLSFWNDEAPTVAYLKEIESKNVNVDVNHIKQMNVRDIDFQAEEPVDAQALYSMIDAIIQEILNNKNADIPMLVENAASDFQSNNLDYAE